MRFIESQWTPSAKQRRARLRGAIDVSGFAGVMLALLFLMMSGEMYITRPKSLPVDMAPARNASSQPNARREDAVIVGITRDGSLYAGSYNTRVSLADLTNFLRDVMHDREDKTIYVKADARAKYGDVKVALDAIRSANVTNIVFLTERPRAVSTP
jgi:biopolymer transport protein ExbD/biopolymer transport protein TolR